MPKQIPTPKPRPGFGKEGMGSIERDNYDVLRASKRNFTEEESRYLATNPAGRLSPQPQSLNDDKRTHAVPAAPAPPAYPQKYTDEDAQIEATNPAFYGR